MSSPNRPATFDENTWYQVSEGRVDTGGRDLNFNLVVVGPPRGLEILNNDQSWWQFLHVDDVENRYKLRTLRGGANFHLSVCYVGEEVHPAKTRLCMAPQADVDEQKWEAFNWDDGTTGIRFINVKNGTDWWLDVHKGNPPFMNDDIDTSILQPAQRWFVSSISAVDDPAFAVGSQTAAPGPENTLGNNPANPTASDTSAADNLSDSPSSDSSKGISAGAAAGIGIGCGAIVLLACLALFLLYRRKQQKKLKEAQSAPVVQEQWGQQDSKGWMGSTLAPAEVPTPEARYEAPTGQVHHELDSAAYPPKTTYSPSNATSTTAAHDFSFDPSQHDHIVAGVRGSGLQGQGNEYGTYSSASTRLGTVPDEGSR